LEAGNKNYLLKTDKAILGKWNNQIREFKVIGEMVRISEEKLRKKAFELIRLLKKEYYLK